MVKKMTIDKKSLRKLIGMGSAILGGTFVGLFALAKKRAGDSVYDNEPNEKNPLEGKKVIFVEDERDKKNADGINGHLEAVGDSQYNLSVYDKYVKRGVDILISFAGLIFLSPLYVGIALAIKIDDPGPVLFTQKRVGKRKEYFKMHKFRSMKMATPHDVPTHMLEKPEQYITRVGKFIRAHSLDELPQIWDVFIGNMSIIGPRPALWNQDVLTAERDKYGANEIKPGLTGWAQINGRDELEIQEKAWLDGEYVQKQSIYFDIECFLKTISKIHHDDDVVEGGTGKLNKDGRDYIKGKTEKELIGNIGFSNNAKVNINLKKKVLITGEGSYIGESFRKYAEDNYPSNFEINVIDTMNPKWKMSDFSSYDIIYHVAGIAHADIGKVDEETKNKYYKINTDLAVDVCRKAKNEGVKSFIFMSSIIVYGDIGGFGNRDKINKNTVPIPMNFYGDSKLQADVAVREFADEDFNVVVIRPPMIYGTGSKGNYQKLVKIAKFLPFFPDVDNKRSMLYIDNLCELLCQVMLVDALDNEVVLLPQNADWVKTSEMVKEIGEKLNSRVRLTKMFNGAIKLCSIAPGKMGNLVDKAFGNLVIEHEISRYEGIDYQKKSFEDSINSLKEKTKKKILFLVNHDVVIYNFRIELVERFLKEGFEVHISSPYGERIDELIAMGAIWHNIQIERHSMNVFTEIRLLSEYNHLFKQVNPDIILGYTIKPNIYGAMVAQKLNIPFVANITGLGSAVENTGLKQNLFIIMYKIAFRKIQRVFFQNEDNRQLFIDNKIAIDKHAMLPGSGVNLKKFAVSDYPSDEVIKFLFLSRIMKEKGIESIM